MNEYQWWVLNINGEVITKFEWPLDETIEEVKNGYMYIREKNETGVASIVKYKFVLN